MKKQILFIVLMAFSMSVLGVTFPQNVSNNNNIGSEGTQSMVGGVTIHNQTTIGGYSGNCTYETWKGDASACAICCDSELQCEETDDACWDMFSLCMDRCGEPLGGLPLDAPTLLLLALIMAYGAYVYYRNRIMA